MAAVAAETTPARHPTADVAVSATSTVSDALVASTDPTAPAASFEAAQSNVSVSDDLAVAELEGAHVEQFPPVVARSSPSPNGEFPLRNVRRPPAAVAATVESIPCVAELSGCRRAFERLIQSKCEAQQIVADVVRASVVRLASKTTDVHSSHLVWQDVQALLHGNTSDSDDTARDGVRADNDAGSLFDSHGERVNSLTVSQRIVISGAKARIRGGATAAIRQADMPWAEQLHGLLPEGAAGHGKVVAVLKSLPRPRLTARYHRRLRRPENGACVKKGVIASTAVTSRKSGLGRVIEEEEEDVEEMEVEEDDASGRNGGVRSHGRIYPCGTGRQSPATKIGCDAAAAAAAAAVAAADDVATTVPSEFCEERSLIADTSLTSLASCDSTTLARSAALGLASLHREEAWDSDVHSIDLSRSERGLSNSDSKTGGSLPTPPPPPLLAQPPSGGVIAGGVGGVSIVAAEAASGAATFAALVSAETSWPHRIGGNIASLVGAVSGAVLAGGLFSSAGGLVSGSGGSMAHSAQRSLPVTQPATLENVNTLYGARLARPWDRRVPTAGHTSARTPRGGLAPLPKTHRKPKTPRAPGTGCSAGGKIGSVTTDSCWLPGSNAAAAAADAAAAAAAAAFAAGTLDGGDTPSGVTVAGVRGTASTPKRLPPLSDDTAHLLSASASAPVGAHGNAAARRRSSGVRSGPRQVLHLSGGVAEEATEPGVVTSEVHCRARPLQDSGDHASMRRGGKQFREKQMCPFTHNTIDEAVVLHCGHKFDLAQLSSALTCARRAGQMVCPVCGGVEPEAGTASSRGTVVRNPTIISDSVRATVGPLRDLDYQRPITLPANV
eukprot:TRINITY_DN33569_c0_g1_i1.p1 TRINITY_DN33569_c0_g1~~TRINITY_DN33569_c0_g1_i1.p1  ORF type:complete len:840 (+),score=134.49 TRINITY_DN33569_c0_g1_i1:79-2598(+)